MVLTSFHENKYGCSKAFTKRDETANACFCFLTNCHQMVTLQERVRENIDKDA
jgi:hypothetical protein